MPHFILDKETEVVKIRGFIAVPYSTLLPSLALTISTNSGLRLAPPTRKPSMSGLEPRVGAEPAFTEPP